MVIPILPLAASLEAAGDPAKPQAEEPPHMQINAVGALVHGALKPQLDCVGRLVARRAHHSFS
jgi:hypothetical protein